MIFGDLTKKAEKLAAELSAGPKERKLKALEVLGEIAEEDVKPLRPAVKALAATLGDPSTEVRVAALRLLQTMSRTRSGLRKDIVKEVLERLPGYGNVLTEALSLLQKQAPMAKEVVEANLPALVALLESEAEGPREGAIFVLEALGVPARNYASGIAEARKVLEDAARCGAEVEKADYMLKAARSGMKKGFFSEVEKDLELAKELANNGRRVVRLWRYMLPGARALDIAPSGRFLCACGSERRLHCVDQAGVKLWSREINEGAASLSVSPDADRVAVGGGDGRMRCLDARGEPVWEVRMSAPAFSMDVADSGAVFASGGDNNVYVIGPGGTPVAKHWTERAGWRLGVSGDGDHLVITFRDHNVYCYDHNLFLRWKFMGGIWVDVCISHDGETVVAGSQGNDIVAFSRMGVVSWKARSDEPVTHLAVSDDGECVYAADAKFIYAYGRGGKPMFKYPAREQVLSMACSADGEHLAVAFPDRVVLMRNREMVRQQVQQSGVLLENIQRMGVDVQVPAQLLEKSHAAFEAGDYESGTELWMQARHTLDISKSQRAESLITQAVQVINEAKQLGADVSKSVAAVATARECIQKGQLDRVLLLLGQARGEAEISRRVREEVLKAESEAKAQSARNAIQDAIALTDEAVEYGMESGQAEVLLQRAIAAVDAGEHDRALQVAQQLEAHVREEKEKLPGKMDKGFRTAAELVDKGGLTPEEAEMARSHLSKVIIYYEKTGELRRLAEAYERLGFLMEKLGKIPYSKFLYQKAVNAYFKVGEIDQVLMLLVERLKRLETLSDKKVPEYIIEELFLIYRDGRLIHHNTRRLRPEVDNQILGGMLIAIQHFVAESFKEKDGEKAHDGVGDKREILNELRYGKTRIIVEAGRFVYLALVFSGQEPEDMREKMKRAVTDIEEKYRLILETWNGDASKLWGAKKMVEPLITGI